MFKIEYKNQLNQVETIESDDFKLVVNRYLALQTAGSLLMIYDNDRIIYDKQNQWANKERSIS